MIDLLKPENRQIQNIDKQQSHFFPHITVPSDVRDKVKLTELLKGTGVVVLLAAEYRDDVSLILLYYDVNVTGMQNTLAAMDANGVKWIVFTSSVAVYGLNKKNPNEDHPKDLFTHYGKSKWQTEWVYCRNGISHTLTGTSISSARLLFLESGTGEMFTIF